MGRTVREYLRDETSPSHDRLDRRLGSVLDGTAAGYAEFLAIQYRARKGIEDWLERSAIPNAPPSQVPLIARDLAALGARLPLSAPRFDGVPASDPLGVCWVLAGSSLGNRAILAQMRKAGSAFPVTFLSDPSMTDYWQTLRPALAQPVDPIRHSPMLAGAGAVFEHFNAVVVRHLSPVAA